MSGGFDSVLWFNSSCISREWAGHSPGGEKFELPMQDDLRLAHIASGWIKAETEETCAERMKESSSRNDCFIAYFFPWYFLPCSFTDDDPHKKKVYLELPSSGGLMQFAASIRPSWISRMWAVPDTLQVGNLRSNWKTSCVEDLSAPHKRRIPELKENCTHVIPGPLERS